MKRNWDEIENELDNLLAGRNKIRKVNIIRVSKIIFLAKKSISTGDVINKLPSGDKLTEKPVRNCFEEIEKMGYISLERNKSPKPWIATWN